MASSPTPISPSERPQRPMSAMIRPHRSNSRISISSKQGGSRASDEDAKTSVKVGMLSFEHGRSHMYHGDLDEISG